MSLSICWWLYPFFVTSLRSQQISFIIISQSIKAMRSSCNYKLTMVAIAKVLLYLILFSYFLFFSIISIHTTLIEAHWLSLKITPNETITWCSMHYSRFIILLINTLINMRTCIDIITLTWHKYYIVKFSTNSPSPSIM